MDRRNNGGAIAAIVITPLAAMTIWTAISRAREFEADRSDAISTEAPLTLASVLRKLEWEPSESRWTSGQQRQPIRFSQMIPARSPNPGTHPTP